MKYLYSSLAVVASAAVATAQIPACATGCIADAVKSSTSCGATDLTCQCKQENASKIQESATPCVIQMCGPEAINVLTAAKVACASVKAAGSAPSSTTAASLAITSSAALTTSALSPSSTIESYVITTEVFTSSEVDPVTISIISSYAKPSVGTGLPHPGANGTAVSTGFPQITSAAGQLIMGIGSVCVAALAAFVVF